MHRELAAFAGAGGVEDRQFRCGTGIAKHVLQLEELAVPVEGFGAGPECLDDVEPFLRVAVACLVIVGERQSERFILRLVPAGDDVEADAAAADLVHGCQLLGDNDWMVGGGVDGGEDIDVARLGQERGRPGDRFQHVAMEIGFPAVANPAGDRQHEVDAGVVEHPGKLEIVCPRVVPAFRYLGHRHAAGAVARKGTEQEMVGREHAVALRGHSLFSVLCWNL